MKTAVAYARYSSDKQREESITAQLRAIYDYAHKNDIEVIREYKDEGKSATSDDRPGFRQMFYEIKEIKPDLVLVHKLDRFARDRFDSAIYRREIQRANARLIAVDQPLDDSPESALLESLLEGMNEFYSKNLAREVMKGMTENAHQAKFNGGWVPLGYDIDSDKNYVINESEAETIKLIFNMKLQGNSYTAIAEELNKQGRFTKRGRPFGKNSIYEILRNEKYCGTYLFNQTPKKVAGKRNNRVKKDASQIIRVENAIPIIIPREEWGKVQEMMNGNVRTKSRTSSTVFILSGILRCPECGSAMTGQSITKTVKGEKQKYYYYMCSMAKRTGECSHTKQYRKEPLEEKAIEALKNRVIKVKDIPNLADQLWAEINKININRDEEQEKLIKQLKEVEKTIENYMHAIEKGAAVDLIIDKFNQAGEQKKYLEARIAERRSPFDDLTKKDIVKYLKSQQSIEIDEEDLTSCKKIIAECCDSATIADDSSLKIIFKYHFGTDNHGVGGGT